MRAVVVTGIGLLSPAGEGIEAHRAALAAGTPPPVDAARFAPYPVHPIGPVAFDQQIPKRADQRQMEPWQRLGVHAAGLALDSAGAKDDADLKGRMHLVVAAGGGERDYAADAAILTGLRDAPDPGAYLNERLTSDLRPTLFLAQLSNLLAGNIAIVHGVTGASRTFMGEEAAGTDALRVAHARVASGQIDAVLVGGSYNAERADAVLVHALGGYALRPDWAPVRERGEPGGFVLASGAAFLVLESADHAAVRGARALARLAGVASDRVARRAGAVEAILPRLWAEAGADARALPISGASGVAGITAEEFSALAALAPGSSPLAIGDLAGHLLEAQAPFGAALAAGLIDAGEAEAAAVSVVGHRRGAGVVRLARAG